MPAKCLLTNANGWHVVDLKAVPVFDVASAL